MYEFSEQLVGKALLNRYPFNCAEGDHVQYAVFSERATLGVTDLHQLLQRNNDELRFM